MMEQQELIRAIVGVTGLGGALKVLQQTTTTVLNKILPIHVAALLTILVL